MSDLESVIYCAVRAQLPNTVNSKILYLSFREVGVETHYPILPSDINLL